MYKCLNFSRITYEKIICDCEVKYYKHIVLGYTNSKQEIRKNNGNNKDQHKENEKEERKTIIIYGKIKCHCVILFYTTHENGQ